MVKWEYLRFERASGDTNGDIFVRSGAALALLQHLRTFPKSKLFGKEDRAIRVEGFQDDVLNALGELGWELVGTRGGDYYNLDFKRPREG